MFGFFDRRRRDRARAAPFPEPWRAIIARHVPYARRLDADARGDLESHIQVFLAEKHFEGCGGLQLRDVHRVTIAAHACLLLLGRETDYFPRLTTILVYPDAYVVDEAHELIDGVVSEGPEGYAGHTGARLGALILSWADLLDGIRDPTDGVNVAFHEFAHKLDFEDGADDGTPLHDSTRDARRFSDVVRDEHERLQRELGRGRDTLLDPYGAQNPVEFFAVATETFFECPVALRDEHPRLYQVLARYFHQDPATSEGGDGSQLSESPY